MFEGFFSKTYVINLDTRPDRWREFEQECARIGASVQDSRIERFSAVRPNAVGGFPTIGARGCFLSHLSVLEDAARTAPGRPILILEDDVALAKDFSKRAPRVLDELGRQDWWLFYGGYDVLKPEGAGLCEIRPDETIQQSHFIGFSAGAVRDAVSYLRAMLSREPGDALGGPMHVDGAYNWFRRAYAEKSTYAANPPLAGQRRSRSDVAAAKWHDRLPITRAATDYVRRVLNARSGGPIED